MGFRPCVSPALETSAGFEECKGLLDRGHTAKRQSSPLVLHMAWLGWGGVDAGVPHPAWHLLPHACLPSTKQKGGGQS